MTTLATNMINISVEMKPEFLSDVLVTAFDAQYGGCWYWAQTRPNDKSAWVIDPGDTMEAIWRSVTVREREASGEKAKWATVDHAMLTRGMERLFAPGVLKHLGDLRSAVLSQDAGNIDSGGADVLVQLAIFGEIVYG